MSYENTLHIVGATLVDPKAIYQGVQDVFIAQGKIIAIGKSPEGFNPKTVIHANGQWLIPGIVDLSARLREPGFEYKATLESEMQAALAGGVTSLACPPDTDPALDEPGLVEMLKHRAQQLSQANVYPIGALTKGLSGEQLTEMAELTEAGCVAFSQADQAIINTQVLLRAMQYARTFDFPIWLRAQDPFLSHAGLAHLGALASRMGLVGIPVEAETIALQTYITLARATDVKLHICRVSSAAAIELIRKAKGEGLKITCDVSIHHVHLCDNDMGFFDPHARLSPPLRSDRDRAAITEGLLDGTIDAICSDHSPVDADCKQLPFGEAEIGATGLELLLPLTIQWGKQNFHGLSSTEAAAKACALITEKSAKILLPNASNIANLSIGAIADLCLFDPTQTWQVTPQNLYSQGHNTPFLNYEMQGKVTKTLVAGKIVYQAT